MSDVLRLLQRLVRVDSVNPDLVPGGAGERGIAETIEAWALEQDLPVERFERHAGRPSLLVGSRTGSAGPTLLLCAHTDTVGVAAMADPFSGRLEGDRLYGRGAYDMKGGLAAALVACRDAAHLGLAGGVVVACVADEEHASLGVREILEHVHADAAVVTEPTEGRVAVAHKGFVWAEVEVTGVAAHGSRPHLGRDAIVHAGAVLCALGDLDERLAARSHPLLGRPSVHASLVAGGTEMSSYPDSCRIALERRTLPGESAEDVDAEVRSVLTEARARQPDLEATARVTLTRDPFEIDVDAALVASARRAARTAGLATADPIGVSYWADAAFLAAAGVPTVLLGPAGEGAHAVEEWVDVPSCEKVADALVALAEELCR